VLRCLAGLSTPCRLPVVLRVLYLIFTEGYAASTGEELLRPTAPTKQSGWPGSCIGCCPPNPR
jgi:hypothetical protein